MTYHFHRHITTKIATYQYAIKPDEQRNIVLEMKELLEISHKL